MQTAFFKYRMIEILILLEKENVLNLLCDLFIFTYFAIYLVKEIGSVVLIVF